MRGFRRRRPQAELRREPPHSLMSSLANCLRSLCRLSESRFDSASRGQHGEGPVCLRSPLVDRAQTLDKSFTEHSNLGFSQHLEMSAVDFADLYFASRASPPTHFWIANVVKRLSRSFEEQHGRTKTRRLEVVTRPVHLSPGISGGSISSRLAFDRVAQDRQLLLERQFRKLANSLQVVIDPP